MLGANLVGHWPLNGDANDISGHGNDGIAYNNPVVADGIPGTGNQSFRFDGSTQRIEVPHNNQLDITGQNITISVWVKVEEKDYPDLYNSIVTKTTGSWSDGYGLFFREAVGTFQFIIAGTRLNPGVNTEYNKWFHIVGTQGFFGRKIYVNGEMKNSSASIEEIPSNFGTVGMMSTSGEQRQVKGFLSDVRIYDIALTAEEISRIYAETKDNYLVYE
jgi:hypothetical protein